MICKRGRWEWCTKSKKALEIRRKIFGVVVLRRAHFLFLFRCNNSVGRMYERGTNVVTKGRDSVEPARNLTTPS